MRITGARALGAIMTLALLPTGAHAAAGLAPHTTVPGLSASATEGTDAEDARLLLLLDGSRSMEDPDAEGAPKIDAAKSAVRAVIDDLDSGQRVGLRTFGATVPVDRPMDVKCGDTELVVPIGADNASALTSAVEDYTPTGETPIGLALQEAAADLGDTGPRTVLLVSDGIATCDPDPCEVAEQLTADGLELVVHTVGLGVDDAARSQLQCIAEASGGSYHDAEDTESLTEALTRISTRALRSFTIEGTPVEGALETADAPVLTPGQYTDTIAPRTEAAKHYRIERTIPGSTIYAGASLRAASQGTVQLEMFSEDGSRCDWEPFNILNANHMGGFGSLQVTSGGAGGSSCPDGDLVLSVFPTDTGSKLGGTPVEIVVAEEPPAENAVTLPGTAEDPELTPFGEDRPQPSATIAGGSGLNDAPMLTPGTTYETDIVPGEVLFYQVPVEWGQQLEVQAEYDEAAREKMYGSLSRLMILGPDRGSVRPGLTKLEDGTTDFYHALDRDGAAPMRMAVVAPEVRWGNREAVDAAKRTTQRAGTYTIALSFTGEDKSVGTPVPLTLTPIVHGDVDGEPVYASAGLQDETPTTAAPEDDDLSSDDVADEAGQATADTGDREQRAMEAPAATPDAATQEESGDSGISTTVWGLGGLGALLAAAGAVLLGRRSA